MRSIIRCHFVFFSLFLICQSGTAQVTSDRLSELDVAKIQSVTDAQVSPDGSLIAYQLVAQRKLGTDDNGPSFTELHVVDKSGVSRPFITGNVSISQIRWAPDSKGISFLTKRNDDEHTSLYVIPSDGGEARKLVQHETDISGYSWRSDGKQIAFLATQPKDKKLKENEDKGFDAEVYEEQLQPVRIWLADADFETDDKPVMLDTAGSCSELEYSPDGTRLSVAIAPSPLIDDFYMYRRVHVLDARDGKVLAKIENPGKIGPIRWSPDSQYLAICSGEDINDPSEGRLTIVPAGGGLPQDIMPDYLPNVTDVQWLTNDQLAFIAEDSCARRFGRVNRDGSDQRFFLESDETPIFGGMTVSADKTVAAMYGSTPIHPNEVFVFEKGKLEKLTTHNKELSGKKLGRQEVFSWTSRDNKKIDGVLLYPVDYQAGTAYPLIIYVHGGPEASVPNGWNTSYSDPGQVAAGRGFFVFFPNYRGSTGRGVAFAKDHQSDYGGKEFNDIIDGLDALIEKGLVDRARVGITGGSYGGFATAWCCTYHTERFAAGVMFVGISNQISKSGTTDIPDEMFHVHARKRIWDDWQFFLERSPIYYVQKCQTPLLILHGKNDTRVHPSQSMELYRNLKILQKPVRLIFYPGEGHGNRKAGGRYDYNLRMMRWMQHYLQNGGGSMPPYALDYGLKVEDDETQADPAIEKSGT